MEIDMGIGGLEFESGVTRFPGLVISCSFFQFLPVFSCFFQFNLKTFLQEFGTDCFGLVITLTNFCAVLENIHGKYSYSLQMRVKHNFLNLNMTMLLIKIN